jgi:putative ABC transport system permease protein
VRAFLDELDSAARELARAPVFTGLAVAVLALGIGSVVFMYGAVDSILLRPAPYPAAERIYAIQGRDPIKGQQVDTVAALDYAAMAAGDLPVEAIGAVYSGTVYLTGVGPATRHDGGFATASLFDVAGVGPALGRVLDPADELPDAAPVVVLGDALWRERYGADPAVLGRRVRLNGVDTEIVGVMPPGFSFPFRQELWLPRQPEPTEVDPLKMIDVMVLARLPEGQAADVMQQALARVAEQRHADSADAPTRSAFELVTLGGAWVGEVGRKLLWTLLAAVGGVLLIACANVSNLLLSRAAWRMREASIRAALGAARGRLVLHLLAESVLISASAAALGLLLAAMALDGMRLVLDAAAEAPPWLDFGISWPIVLLAILLAFATSLLAGLPAALRATRPSLDAMLRDGGRGGSGPAIGRIAWGLVVGEIALSAAVLGGAALMTRAVLQVTALDVGVATSELMTARVGLPLGAYNDPTEQAEFFARYVERLEAQPEVEAGGLMMWLPGHGLMRSGMAVEGEASAGPETLPPAGAISVSPSIFATLRLQPLQGRLLETSDWVDTEPVVVVNESFARTLWPGQSPLGRRARSELPGEPWRTVVGVVPDVVHDVEKGRAEPTAYLPLAQQSPRFVSVVVRGEGGPAALAAAMRTALAETDPNLALYWERTLDESLGLRTAGLRIVGALFALCGAIALVIAASGLFGVLSFHVMQRTREIGVRRALGADDGRILGLVVRATGLQVAVGLGLGLAALPLLEGVLDRVLFNLDLGSASVYLGVLALMVVVVAAAVVQPTWRALRIDPAVALRHE